MDRAKCPTEVQAQWQLWSIAQRALDLGKPAELSQVGPRWPDLYTLIDWSLDVGCCGKWCDFRQDNSLQLRQSLKGLTARGYLPIATQYLPICVVLYSVHYSPSCFLDSVFHLCSESSCSRMPVHFSFWEKFIGGMFLGWTTALPLSWHSPSPTLHSGFPSVSASTFAGPCG